MVFDNIDSIIEGVLRSELVLEGTHVKDYRKRAFNVFMAKGEVPDVQAEVWEDWLFTHHFHGMPNKIIRLEPFFASAFLDVGLLTDDETEEFDRLIKILDFIKKNYQKDGFYNISQLTMDNASTYKQLDGIFGKLMDDEARSDEARANSYGEETQMNGGYSVRNVTSFEEAHEIGKYSGVVENPSSRLCFTSGQGTWNNYTNDGMNECYVILRDGWENMVSTDYVNDPKRPFDDYGLSMIFLFIDSNGNISTSNTRWNHMHGGGYSGDVDQSFKKSDIAELLGVNFNSVFKPNNKFNEKVKSSVERYLNGEPIDDCFKYAYPPINGLYIVCVEGQWNLMRENGTFLSDRWFSKLTNSLSMDVRYDENITRWKYIVGIDGVGDNYMDENGEFLVKDDSAWFSMAEGFSNGLAKVAIRPREWNYINYEGRLMMKNWYAYITTFREGFGIVTTSSGRQNIVDSEGRELLKDYYGNPITDENELPVEIEDDFYNGFCVVRFSNGKENYIDTDGKILSKESFVMARNFKYGHAVVELDGFIFNVINKKGEMLYKGDLTFETIVFDNDSKLGFIVTYTNNNKVRCKNYLLISNGQLLYNGKDTPTSFAHLYGDKFVFSVKRQAPNPNFNRQYNIIDTEGNTMFSDDDKYWLDEISVNNGTKKESIATICYEKGWDILDLDTMETLCNFDFEIYYIYSFGNGFAHIDTDMGKNLINENGELINGGEMWFDNIGSMRIEGCRVKKKGKGVNFMRQDGTLLFSPDEEWPTKVYDPEEDFCRVSFGDDKYTFVNVENGRLMYNGRIMFANASDFCRGYAMVRTLRGNEYYIDTFGDTYSTMTKSPVDVDLMNESVNENRKTIIKEGVDMPQGYKICKRFDDGTEKIGKNGLYNLLSSDGKLVWDRDVDEWFDNLYGYDGSKCIVSVYGDKYELWNDGTLRDDDGCEIIM